MIERKSEDVFDFDLNWLINLHESINQRITQQSDATLVSFITKITFDDGTSRTIATFDSLKYYAETKNILPIGIHIQWIYLVGFPNRSNPEKQELNFFAISKPRSKEKADIYEKIFSIFRLGSIKDLVLIEYSVSHTERTWGDDIESIFRNNVEKITKVKGGFESLVEFLRYSFSLFLITFMFVSPIYFSNGNNAFEVEKLAELVSEINSLNEMDLRIESKIDLLIESKMSLSSEPKYFILMILLALPVTIAFLKITRFRKTSFINICNFSSIYRTKIIKKESKSYLLVFLSYLIAFVISISATFGADWIKALKDTL